MEAQSNSKRYVIPVVVVLALALIMAVYWINSGNQSTTTQVEADKKTGSINKNALQDMTAKLKDGTHESEVTYGYHAGEETIDIKLSTVDDVIQSISVTPVGTPHPYSLQMINGVNGGLPDLVVGKKIEDVELPKQISGSSLTTAAVDKYLKSLYQ